MEGIRSTLCYQRHLASRGTALIGVVARRGYPEFLDGIQRRANRALEWRARCLRIVVHAVERQVCLVAAPAV